MITDDDYPYRAPPGSKTWQPELPPLTLPEPRRGELPILCPPLALMIAGAMGLLSIGNVMLMPMGEAMSGAPSANHMVFFTLALAGSIGAQASILAILVVYSTGSYWLRLVWHWVLAAVALFAWCVGYVAAFVGNWRWAIESEIFFAFVCGLPLIALACQAPHWLMRLYFHWRIERSDEPESVAVRPLAISDFLVGTIVVALTIMGLRVGHPYSGEHAFYWAGWFIGAGVTTGITIAVALPTVVIVLRVRDWRLAILGVVLFTVLLIVLFAAGLIYITPVSGPSDRLRIFISFSLVVGFMSALAGTLGLLRWQGNRLVTANPKLASAQKEATQVTTFRETYQQPPATPTGDAKPPTA